MRPARWLPDRRDHVRLLAIDPVTRIFEERPFGALPDLLEPGDLLVVNDAATLPASLPGCDSQAHFVEARLVAAAENETFWAALLGEGDWRQRTEDRPPPPLLKPGARLAFGGLGAHVVEVSPRSARLVRISFDASGAALWAQLYRYARPIQYSHSARDLPLWAVQTVYASRPWAFEMPSAGRPLSWEILLDLRKRGVRLAAVTHAAGISATGDPAIDAALPLPERYQIEDVTVRAVSAAQEARKRVVAVGTSVVRALEGAASQDGTLRSGCGITDLRLDRSYEPRIVDAVISGVHDPAESHFALLTAFADEKLLAQAWAYAEERDFRSHEMGDVVIVLPPHARQMYRVGAAA